MRVAREAKIPFLGLCLGMQCAAVSYTHLDVYKRQALKIIEAGYRFGFLLAPLFLEDEWQKRYRALLEQLADILPQKMPPFTFELITHRFTSRARRQIEALYPGSGLNMDPEQRQFRYGQFGYGKYLYPPQLRREAEEFFKREIKSIFPTSTIEYFI